MPLPTAIYLLHLSLKTREDYFRLLEEALSKNLHTCVVFPSVTAAQVTEAAVRLEYELFSANRVVTMYRRGMTFLVSTGAAWLTW